MKIVVKALLILSLFPLPVLAQETGVISGQIIDERTDRSIEFATVLLLKLPDSTEVQGTVTDRRGRFTFEKIPHGTYIIRSSFIGYEINESGPFSISDGSLVHQVGSLSLSSQAKNLGEVVLTSRKPMLNTGIDRKIYNVGQDIMSTSGVASDILKNIPSVEVDLDGAVSLRGSGDVMILINGKPSPLMGRSRAEVLQQLPANSIERIEVITNPSARYKPDGTGGIINIVLKKNLKNGFNGSVAANAGTKNRFNGNVNLNYRPKNFNLFASYGLRKDSRNRFGEVTRFYFDSTTGLPVSYNTQHTDTYGNPTGHVLNGGIDYTINEHNSWGVSGSYFHRNQDRNEIARYNYYDEQDELMEKYDRLRYIPEYDRQHSFTGYYQKLFKGSEDHELRFEFNRSIDTETEDNRYTNKFYLPNASTTYENIILKTIENENELTIDYSNPFAEDSKLEAGYDGFYNRIDLDFLGEYFDPLTNSFLKDHSKSNRFIYKEDVHAIYLTYQKNFEKWGYSAGLRAEQVYGNSHLLTLDSVVENSYFNVYPTIHLSYKINDEREWQLNYSKRVNRPDGDELNPFPEFLDPRNIRSGNPKLKPEIIHSVELGYQWQKGNFSFVPSLYYRHRLNGFTSVTRRLNDSTLLTTEENLDKDHSAGLELIFSATAGKILTINLSSNFFYNRIDASSLGFGEEKDIVSMSSNMNANLNFAKNSLFQLSTNYRSARLTAQGKSFPSFTMNAGLRQNLFDNKLALTLTFSDIFNSLRFKNELNTEFYKQYSTSRRDGTIIYFGLSYRFGITKKEKEAIEYDDNM